MKIRKSTKNDLIPWELLLDADPSRKHVGKYLKRGELWLADDRGKIKGEMVLLQTHPSIIEIMNIATDVRQRSKGIGTKLLKKARQRAKQLGAKQLVVGTGNNSFRQLQFYQRFGFRVYGIKKDFFVKRYARRYKRGGVVLRDMIRMKIAV